MALRSGFFNSINGDRTYHTGHWAEYFASFIGNGVFPNPSNNLQVASNNNMTITIKPGKAWINGYILINDSDYQLSLTPADGVLNRIDRIVARYDTVARAITLEVKQGAFASNPVAPTLQRDADGYELAIADIRINAGVISITQANITDTRLNSDLCGIVHGVVEQVDTTTLFNQYQSWIEQEKLRFENDVDDWLANEQLDFETWEQQQKDDFDMWFSNIQDILDGNVAANLQNQITQLEEDLGNIDAPSTQEFESLQSDFSAHQADNASLKNKGHVQLSNATNSTSNALAATPSAVKSAMDRADEAFTSASNGKQLVGNAITGVDPKITIPTDPTFQQLSEAIGQISPGIKSASGSVRASDYVVSVMNLDFEPSLVYIYSTDFNILGVSGRGWGIFSKFNNTTSNHTPSYTVVGGYGGQRGSSVSGGDPIITNTPNDIFFNGGFTLRINALYSSNATITWRAYE